MPDTTGTTGMIVALDRHRVMGVNGGLPWRHAADLARFKRLTLDGTVIMGRKTFESIGRPLPRRRNLVVSRTMAPRSGVEVFGALSEAVAAATGPIWYIGGRGIYAEAMARADFIDVTWVPDELHFGPEDEVVYFPPIGADFEAGPVLPFPDSGAEGLQLQRFIRARKTSHSGT